MSAIPTLGPARTGTLVTGAFEATVSAYVNYLSMSIVHSGKVSAELAASWGADALAGRAYSVLRSESGIDWIRVVEDTDIDAAIPFKQHGWMSLEVVVEDVDQLAVELKDSPFEMFRPPADLDVSDDIRAMQMIGPAGEVLYLTQVKGPVPPFEIPMATARVDHLFIPVMSCENRDKALNFYQQFPNGKDYSFDTKITSVNAAFGFDIDRKHPVATVQLAGNTMIEIDEIKEASPRTEPAGHLPAGIGMISFEVASLDAVSVDAFATPQQFDEPPYLGRKSLVCRGFGGELVELIESAR